MKKWGVLFLVVVTVAACSIAAKNKQKPVAIKIPAGTYEDTLRFLYSLPKNQWPAPLIDSGVIWQELGMVPESPIKPYLDSLKNLIALGNTLFFDTRLSGSNQISCGTCHVPDLSWTDGRQRSLGHEQQENKRNSPTLLNVWHYSTLFWDGRSHSLEDQAFAPINSEIEMHSDMGEVMYKLRRIKEYKPMFDAAFGSTDITPERLTEALATFQRTIVSNKAAFDHFLQGNKSALTNDALRGLHLFRTKARCMNCHNGTLLTDNQFHNIGLTNYKTKQEDLGRYNFTKKNEDVGKFRTPSLRDVMLTRPWMHNGQHNNIHAILNLYNNGMPQPLPNQAEKTDPMFPKTDRLIKRLNLNSQEINDIVAFLNAVTAPPTKVSMPVMPQ